MLNVRAKPYRKVAYSSDGGESWSALQDDKRLIDPDDNGSIIRYSERSDIDAEAHWLVFSNTADTSHRRNLTVRLSCDDGATWPIARTVDPGPAAYSTLARLQDDRFALLYERDEYKYMTIVTFDPSWVGPGCPLFPPNRFVNILRV